MAVIRPLYLGIKLIHNGYNIVLGKTCPIINGRNAKVITKGL